MDRETKQFTTPGGHVVTMHTYITGREQRELTGVFLQDTEVKVDVEKKKGDFGSFKGSSAQEAELKALKFLVVAIGIKDEGTPIQGEKAVDAVLDLPAVEYVAIVKEINAITSPKTEETAS